LDFKNINYKLLSKGGKYILTCRINSSFKQRRLATVTPVRNALIFSASYVNKESEGITKLSDINI